MFDEDDDDVSPVTSQIVIELHQDPLDEHNASPAVQQPCVGQGTSVFTIPASASPDDTVTLDLEACPPHEMGVIRNVTVESEDQLHSVADEKSEEQMKQEEQRLLDDSEAQSSFAACTFTLIEGVSQRGRPKLFDAEGYSYSLRNPHHRDEHRAWRCTSRSQKRRCDASILQKGNKFFPMHMPHTHLPKLDAEAMATVRAVSKRKSDSMPTVPSAKIVRDTLSELIPEKCANFNTHVVSMIAKCVTRYRKTRLKEKLEGNCDTNVDLIMGESSPNQALGRVEEVREEDDQETLQITTPAKRPKLILSGSESDRNQSPQSDFSSAGNPEEQFLMSSKTDNGVCGEAFAETQSEKPPFERDMISCRDDDIFNYIEMTGECLDTKTLLENVPSEFLRKHIQHKDCQHIVLATSNQINLLCASKALYFDIASSFTPQPFLQLLTIKTFIKKNEAYEHVPVAFCLMSRNGREDYKMVLESLFDPILSEDFQFKTLVAELDISLWKALKDVLPRRRIRTCCSHFRKNIRRYLEGQNMHLSMNVRGPLQTYIHKVLSLCLLPSTDVAGMFDFLEKEARTEKMSDLIKYVETYFIENAVWGRHWSVFDCPIRTYSDVNNWLRWLSSSKNPVSNFESFIDMIFKGSRALSDSAELLPEAKLKRLQNQDSASVHRRLYQNWEEHKDGSISAKKLLFSCCQLSNQIDRALTC